MKKKVVAMKSVYRNLDLQSLIPTWLESSVRDETRQMTGNDAVAVL